MNLLIQGTRLLAPLAAKGAGFVFLVVLFAGDPIHGQGISSATTRTIFGAQKDGPLVPAPTSLPVPVRDAARRIAEVDVWLRIHGSPLRATVEANARPRPTLSVRPRGVQAMAPGVNPLQQSKAGELAALNQEFADAVAEMRALPLDPAQTVRAFDEFQKVNREAIEDQRYLRRQLSAESAARTATEKLPPVPGDTEEARRFDFVQKMKARQATDNLLAPAERIAAFDRAAATYPPLWKSLHSAPAAPFPSTK